MHTGKSVEKMGGQTFFFTTNVSIFILRPRVSIKNRTYVETKKTLSLDNSAILTLISLIRDERGRHTNSVNLLY